MAQFQLLVKRFLQSIAKLIVGGMTKCYEGGDRI
jgi:hypothetical protein